MSCIHFSNGILAYSSLMSLAQLTIPHCSLLQLWVSAKLWWQERKSHIIFFASYDSVSLAYYDKDHEARSGTKEDPSYKTVLNSKQRACSLTVAKNKFAAGNLNTLKYSKGIILQLKKRATTIFLTVTSEHCCADRYSTHGYCGSTVKSFRLSLTQSPCLPL